MLRKVVFCILCCLLPLGCSYVSNTSDNYSHKISLEEQLKDHAIVVCKVKNEEKVSRGKYWFFPPVTYFVFQNEHGDKFCVDDSSDEWTMKRIKPGVYRLSEASRLVERCTTYWYDIDCYFCVKQGAVIYLDDLSFYPTSRKVIFTNNFEKAKLFLQKNAGRLSQKIEREYYLSLKDE